MPEECSQVGSTQQREREQNDALRTVYEGLDCYNNIGGNQCVCRGGIWEAGRENPREREVRIDAEFSFMTSATHRSENVSL